MARSGLVVLALAAFAWSTPATALLASPPEDPEPRWRTVARWYGSFDHDGVKYASREPGMFGMALSSPHHHQVSSGTIVLREEVDDAFGMRRTVAESLSWSTSVTDMYYVERDGTRVKAGSGGSGTRSLSAGQLEGEPNAEPQRVAELRRKVADARSEVARRARERQEADREAAGAPTKKVPVNQLEADALEGMERYQLLAADPKATLEQRNEAARRMQETSQKYSDWIQRRVKELEEKHVTRSEALRKILEDPAATNEQKEEAGKQLSVLGDEMSKEQESIFGKPDPKGDARDRADEAARAVESAQEDLRSAQRELAWLQLSRNGALQAHAEVAEVDGRSRTSVSVRVEDRMVVDLPVRYTGLGFATDPPGGSRLAVELKGEKELGASAFAGLSGQADADEEGAATISGQTAGGSGEDGLIGGHTYASSFTISRVPVKQLLTVRGSLLHRIRIPQSDADHNLVRFMGTPWILDGAIPVQGTVRVEARLVDPQAVPPPLTSMSTQPPTPLPPPVNVADSRDGAFELAVPIQRGKMLLLTFLYHSKDAQLTETVTAWVPIDDVLAAWGTVPGTSGAAPLSQVLRRNECEVRWDGGTRRHPLGTETCGGTVRRYGDVHTLSFEGLNSILVNTFILATPYLNQNRHAIEVTAKVPAARLLAMRPAYVPEREVRARLGVPATGSAPEWSTTTVPVKGAVVCFPTSVTMSLGSLGLIPIAPNPGTTGDIQRTAQGVYDFYSAKYANGPMGRSMPELFPFPRSPTMIDSMTESPATEPGVRALQDHLIAQLKARYACWPFVDGNADTKKWLVSLPGKPTAVGMWFGETATFDEEVLRPWQMAWIVGEYVKAAYGAKVVWHTEAPAEHPEWRNVFAIEPRKLLRVLGRGGSSIVSISHLAETGKGGHLIALVGVVIDGAGDVVRLIFNDPYGDQSRNPRVEGYYHLGRPVANDRSKFDRDPQTLGSRPAGQDWGRYAPYGPDVDSYDGRMEGKWWEIYEPKEPETATTLRKRLLPSVRRDN